MPHAPPSPHAHATETRAFWEIVKLSTTPVRVRWDPAYRERLEQICRSAQVDARIIGSGDLQILAQALQDWGMRPCRHVHRVIKTIAGRRHLHIDRRVVSGAEIRAMATTVGRLIENTLSDQPRRGAPRPDERFLANYFDPLQKMQPACETHEQIKKNSNP